MRAANITQADVNEAADHLNRTGERPTVVAVRDYLGRGSYTTIQKLLKVWQSQAESTTEEHTTIDDQTLKAALESLTPALGPILAAARQAGYDAAQQEADLTITGLQADLSNTKAELRDATNEIARLERTQDELLSRLEAALSQQAEPQAEPQAEQQAEQRPEPLMSPPPILEMEPSKPIAYKGYKGPLPRPSSARWGLHFHHPEDPEQRVTRIDWYRTKQTAEQLDESGYLGTYWPE
jgi:hypothetical protein